MIFKHFFIILGSTFAIVPSLDIEPIYSGRTAAIKSIDKSGDSNGSADNHQYDVMYNKLPEDLNWNTGAYDINDKLYEQLFDIFATYNGAYSISSISWLKKFTAIIN